MEVTFTRGTRQRGIALSGITMAKKDENVEIRIFDQGAEYIYTYEVPYEDEKVRRLEKIIDDAAEKGIKVDITFRNSKSPYKTLILEDERGSRAMRSPIIEDIRKTSESKYFDVTIEQV